MFDKLTALGWGLVTFAVTIILGIVIIQKFGDSVARCASITPYNATTQTCYNATSSVAPTNTEWVSGNYLNTQLGSTSGLASYTPLIIIMAIAVFFLGIFMARGGKKY